MHLFKMILYLKCRHSTKTVQIAIRSYFPILIIICQLQFAICCQDCKSYLIRYYKTRFFKIGHLTVDICTEWLLSGDDRWAAVRLSCRRCKPGNHWPLCRGDAAHTTPPRTLCRRWVSPRFPVRPADQRPLLVCVGRWTKQESLCCIVAQRQYRTLPFWKKNTL